MKTVYILPLIVATTLSGCGDAELDSTVGTSPSGNTTPSDPDNGPPPSENTEPLSATTRAANFNGSVGVQQGGSNPVFVLNGASDAGFTKLSNADAHNGALSAFRKSGGTDGIVIFAESGEDRVSVAGNSGFGGQAVIAGQMERLTESNVPVDGSVQYVGDYSAVFVQAESGQTQALTGMIQGDAVINVNFSADEVDGAITNRYLLAPSGRKIGRHRPGTVTLNTASLSNSGAFSGTASGGVFSTNSSVTGGAFQGLVTGAQGQNAIGTVRIDHRLPPKGGDSSHSPTSSSFVEMGAFHTEKQ